MNIKTINWPLLALSFFVCVFNVAYLNPQFVIIHDTMYQFTLFHFFYSEWLFNHDLAAWMPYSTYGVPALFYQLQVFTPCEYLMFVIGKILNITDVMLLFKMSVILSQLVFIYGMYQLTRLLYENRSTIFLICLSAAGSIVWYSNLHVAFRYYYLLPLLAYFLILFFKQRDAKYLWWTGIAGLIWTMGCSPYHIIAWSVTLFVMAVVLFWQNGGRKEYFVSLQKGGLSALIAFVFLLIFFVCCYHTALNGITIDTPGRDPLTGKTDLGNFLNYGGHASWAMIGKGFLLASPVFLPHIGSGWDAPVYVGILGVVFFIYSLFSIREKNYSLFLATALFLAVFSLGGRLAELLFKVPGISYYRHLAFLLEIVKIFVLICAGFGIDRFWKLADHLKLAFFAITAGVFFLLFENNYWLELDFYMHWLKGLQYLADWGTDIALNFLILSAVILMAFLAVFVLIKIVKRQSNAKENLLFWKWGLFLFLLLDLALFQSHAYRTAPLVPGMQKQWASFKAQAPLYQPMRLKSPQTETQKEALELLTFAPDVATYAANFNYVQLDYCRSEYRKDIVVKNVYQLQKINDLDLTLVGCQEDKMHFATSVKFYENEEQGLEEVKTYRADAGGFPIQRPSLMSGDAARKLVAGEAVNLKVKKFTANAVTVDTVVSAASGAWLVYADAIHPGWRAQLDGKPLQLHQAAFAFKAVFVPQGHHQVRFHYSAYPQVLSLLLLILGLLASVTFCLYFFRDLFVRQ